MTNNRISHVAYRVIDTLIQFWKAYFDAKQRVYRHLNRPCLFQKLVTKGEIRDDEWWRKEI